MLPSFILRLIKITVYLHHKKKNCKGSKYSCLLVVLRTDFYNLVTRRNRFLSFLSSSPSSCFTCNLIETDIVPSGNGLFIQIRILLVTISQSSTLKSQGGCILSIIRRNRRNKVFPKILRKFPYISYTNDHFSISKILYEFLVK